MSILNDLVHEAQKKKQQLTQIVGRDVVNPVAHAAGNVSHAIGNTVNAGATAARDTGGAIAATNRVLNTSGEGVRRSIVGTGQGLSGLYDLATPGLGTSRSSKWLNKTAVGIDKKNKNAAFNYLYKPGQAIGDIATFAGGGEVADGAKLLAKGLPGAAKVAKVSNAISKPISRPIINTATKATERYLPGTDTVGRIANSAVHGALHPTNIKANAAFTAMQTGKEAANGQKVTPSQVATNFATGELLGGAGAGALRIPVEALHGGQVAATVAHDVATNKPFRNVSNDEVAAVKRVAQARAGYGPEVTNIQPNDVQVYRQVQKKLGTKNVNDHTAIDDLIGSRMTYDTKMSQMPGVLQGQGGFIGNNPFEEQVAKLESQAQLARQQENNINRELHLTSDGSNQQNLVRDASANDAIQLPNAAASTHNVTPQQLPGEAQALQTAQHPGEVLSNTLPQNTPQSTGNYLKDQIKAQETARKAGNPTGLDKLKASTAHVKTKLIDSLSPIEDTLNQKITPENATSHITPQLDRALRADTIAGQYIKDKGLAKVIQSVPNTKEFDQYLIAKHAADLEKNGVKTGRNLEADKQLVTDLQGKYEPHAQELKKYSQGLLDKSVEYGLISKELASSLKQKYPNYVPANRIFGENELPTAFKGTGGGKASIGTQSVVQRIKGSNRAIESPLDSLVHKTQDVIDQGERNKAAQILTGYRKLPDNPFQLRELGKDETVGTKPVVSFLENGKVRRFETTKEIADAAKSLSKEQLGLIGKILSVPTRVLRLGATSLNPAFTLANVTKDLASGVINSKNPVRSSVANPTVFVQALKASLNHGSKEYGELVREGAGGTSFDIARDAPVQNVAKIRAQKNVGSRVKYTVTHPAQLFRAAEDTIGRSEEFSRALQYYGGKQASLAKGASPEAAKVLAAHAARNNTVNFARAGDYGRVLNSVLPYLNAGIQGSRTLVRNAADRPAQTAAKIAVVGFLPTAAATVWNTSTPDRKAAYDDIKDYEKQGNIIIVPPNPVKDDQGKWNVIKIPVSQEIANLNNIVRNGVEAGLKDGSIDAKSAAANLFGTVTSISGENPRQVVGQLTPQAVKPVVEGVVNQNLYTGNKIVPDSQKNLDAKDQYGTGTSGTAREIGKFTNVSPRQIDNAVRTATGGLGQNVINATDNALAKTGQIKPEDIRGKSIPSAVAGRFTGAQGTTKYDIIDKTNADLAKKLKATDGYKNMSPQDKAKALNRLSSQVTNTYTKKGALSPTQQAIDRGDINVNKFLTTSKKTGGNTTPIATNIDKSSKDVLKTYNAMSEAGRNKAIRTQPDFEYNYLKAKYDNDKANNKLNAKTDIAAQKKLAKAAVGKDYSHEVRDLYTLNKSDLYTYLSTPEKGKDKQKIASDILAYDKALKDAGIIAYTKLHDKNGRVTLTAKNSSGSYTKKASSGGSRKGKSIATLISEFKLPNDSIKYQSQGASIARSAGLAKKKSTVS